MTESEFIESIDCRFPSRHEEQGRRLVHLACELSANAAFAVMHELARPGAGADSPAGIRRSLLSLLSQKLAHPLVPIVVPITERLINESDLTVEEAISAMNAIRLYPGQYAALSIAYFSCDDANGDVERVYGDIEAAWQAG